MTDFNTAQLRQACRIFMDLAYPEGPSTIPPKKRAYYDLDADLPVAAYLPPSACAGGIAQDLSTKRGGCGYEFRLGCAHYQHIKLRVQPMEHQGASVWVYSVDTHDARFAPPPDHPDAPQWAALQENNRQLKDQIEDELEQAGFLTFKSLLRAELGSPVG
jgi:hypothetical protein